MEIVMIILFFLIIAWVGLWGGFKSRSMRENIFYLVSMLVSLTVLLRYGIV